MHLAKVDYKNFNLSSHANAFFLDSFLKNLTLKLSFHLPSNFDVFFVNKLEKKDTLMTFFKARKIC